MFSTLNLSVPRMCLSQAGSAAERKLQEKLAETRAKELAKQDSQSVANANKLLAKVEPMMESVELKLADPNIGLVGDAIVSPLRATLALFADWCGQLRRLIKKGKDADGFFRRVDSKEVTDQIAVCKKQLALVGNMLAIGSKLPSRT